MDTQSSETLETQARAPNCSGSPKTGNGSPFTSSGQVIATAERSPDFEDVSDWDDETDKEDPQDDKQLFVGGGLANLGNTCFLNAVLQCFMHTVPLVKGLLAYNHPSTCEDYIEGFCVLCALKELIGLVLTSNGYAVSPWKIFNNLGYFSSNFQRYQQEDAHEFLQCFLDRLESCCNDANMRELEPSQNGNLVKQTFGGRLISKLCCCDCGHCSDTYEPLIDLSLEIEDVDSVPAALESFTKVERIGDSETKFTCEKCKEQVLIEKQLLLDEAPSVATFHLKRFKNDGSVVEKIDKHVAFPLELDLLPYAIKYKMRNGDSKYLLYAIVVHIGPTSCSGHYYCFIRAAPDAWYKFDDFKVTRVREEYVMSQEAYILFYAKQGTPWFSDFIQTEKLAVPETISHTSPKSVLDIVDGISIPPGIRSDIADVASPKRHGILTQDRVQEDEGNETLNNISTPAVHVTTVCSNEARKMPSPSPLEESNKQGNEARKMPSLSPFEESKTQKIVIPKKQLEDLIPLTPPRSPSPEIYRDNSPDYVYSIPRAHLRSADHDSCYRQLQRKLESDQKRKEAVLLVKKKMPGSRGQQLMAALRGTQSEGSGNKKRRRMDASPIKDRNSTAYHTSNFPSRSHPIIANSHR